MRRRHVVPSALSTGFALLLLSLLHNPGHGTTDTPFAGVRWSLVDYISACPAGDSVIAGVAGHPSRLRILVWYADANGNNKVNVPPESIYVTISTDSGNVRANDLATNTFADDSTKEIGDDGAFTRI